MLGRFASLFTTFKAFIQENLHQKYIFVCESRLVRCLGFIHLSDTDTVEVEYEEFILNIIITGLNKNSDRLPIFRILKRSIRDSIPGHGFVCRVNMG